MEKAEKEKAEKKGEIQAEILKFMRNLVKDTAKGKMLRVKEDGASEETPKGEQEEKVRIAGLKERNSRGCLDSGTNRPVRRMSPDEEELWREGCLNEIVVELANGSLATAHENSKGTIVCEGEVQPLLPYVLAQQVLKLKLTEDEEGNVQIHHPLHGNLKTYTESGTVELDENITLQLIQELEMRKEVGKKGGTKGGEKEKEETPEKNLEEERNKVKEEREKTEKAKEKLGRMRMAKECEEEMRKLDKERKLLTMERMEIEKQIKELEMEKTAEANEEQEIEKQTHEEGAVPDYPHSHHAESANAQKAGAGEGEKGKPCQGADRHHDGCWKAPIPLDSFAARVVQETAAEEERSAILALKDKDVKDGCSNKTRKQRQKQERTRKSKEKANGGLMCREV